MKTFDSTVCTWSEYLESFNSWLNEKLETKLPVIHNFNGPGYITYMKAADNDVYLTIDFPEASKQYSLRFLIEHIHLTLDETVSEVIRDIYDIYTASAAAHQLEIRAEAEAKREADRAKREAIKKEAAEAARREKAIERIKSTRPEAILSEPSSYYEALGWIAKNVKSIKATVPSDLEGWFVKNFGTADHTVVDSNKKTLNGNPMKWSISFRATFKNQLPEIIASKATSNKKAIESVAYIWDLIENHGFCFGTEQNIDKIRSCVPDKFISEFEVGFAI